MRLAKLLGISHNAVSQWERIPWRRARDISRITRIPLYKLRPDVWPPRQTQGRDGPLQPGAS
jgi:DNA-binding transcriptional regulator YdaS (Cro superfamily)